MRKTVLSSLSAFVLTATLLFSCSKEDKSSSSNEVLKNEQKSISESGTGSATLYVDVLTGMSNLGAVEYTPTITDVPLFSGYDRIEYYIADGVVYELYIWSTNIDTGFPSAVSSCTKSWHDGTVRKLDGNYEDSGCYDPGSACDLELRNGNVVVVCCDELLA